MGYGVMCNFSRANLLHLLVSTRESCAITCSVNIIFQTDGNYTV